MVTQNAHPPLRCLNLLLGSRSSRCSLCTASASQQRPAG
ncbi:MAG: hypothetical protein AVDCRST_MAG72-889 [uncultured Nocardioidaceae bacterium]|uniref:Uncharacterized protein n=1 Tax=uncultured Nocardioidaceae bacterium TaxID=253824 RepID=A0A6J4LTS7_9ACTN|nr:MAG: hypothetical protein AVDCRST_MAG72-889 [uncultured Nocardioidaceae bacterium]